MNYTLVAW